MIDLINTLLETEKKRNLIDPHMLDLINTQLLDLITTPPPVCYTLIFKNSHDASSALTKKAWS